MEKDPLRFQDERLTGAIIGAAFEVHTFLGPGLLESAYHDCLCYELNETGIGFAVQPPVSLIYKNLKIERAFRPDLIVENSVIVEIKSVEKLLPIHDSQVMTYLRLTGLATGLIFNFNKKLLKEGLRRIDHTHGSV